MRATCLWALGIVAWWSTLGSLSMAPAVAQKKASQGNLTEFIASDFCVAIVVHPKQIINSPLGAMMPAAGASGIMAGSSGGPEAANLVQKIDPKSLRRVVLLLDPASLETKMPPGVILQFEEDFDGEGFFKQAYDDVQPGTIEGKAVFTSKKAGNGQIAGVGYVASPRTLVMGPEPTVQKMLATSDEPRPLLDQLKRCNLKSDIIVEVLAEPLAKSLSQAASAGPGGMPPQAAMAAGMLQEVKSASLRVCFTGDQLLQLTIVGAKPDSADKIHGQFSFLQMMAAQQVQGQKAAPADQPQAPTGESLAGIGEEILKGLELKKEDDRVLVTIKMPEDLPGLLQKATVAAMQMATPRLEEGLPKDLPTQPEAEK